MAEAEDLAIPGHVSTKKAAKLLGLSYDRVYQLIRAKRLTAVRVSHMLMIPIIEIERFKRNPTGRMRTKPPDWRVYRGGGDLLATEIQVQIRPGQQEALQNKVQMLLEGKRHMFTGSIARYILKNREAPDSLTIWLVWKDTEMPDEVTHQEELEALRAELADVLDWKTAHYSEHEGLIYT